MRLLVVCQLSGDVIGYKEALLDLNFKIGRFALWGGSLDFQKSPSSDLMARDERRRPLATSSLGRPLAASLEEAMPQSVFYNNKIVLVTVSTQLYVVNASFPIGFVLCCCFKAMLLVRISPNSLRRPCSF